MSLKSRTLQQGESEQQECRQDQNPPGKKRQQYRSQDGAADEGGPEYSQEAGTLASDSHRK
ncbi:MAG: hypothetical protein ACLPWF_21585 [Bryobacteraceae bacterium]